LKTLEKIKKQLEIRRKKGKPISAQAGAVQPSGAARAPAPPNRWAPPVSDSFSPPPPRALCPSPLPLPSGAGVSVPVALTRAPFAYMPRGPVSQRNEPFPLRACSLSLRRGTASAPPSPRTDVDQRTRTPRSSAMSPAHAPQLPFEHHPHLHTLPYLILRKLTSLALYSCLSRSPEFCDHAAGRPAR
jgi:hypothetical protein